MSGMILRIVLFMLLGMINPENDIYVSHIYNKSCPIHATEHMGDTKFQRADKV